MAGKNGAKPDNGWLIDLNMIKRRELPAMEADRQKAVDSGDDAPLIAWLARTIKKWPYDSDPANIESYQDLGLLEYMEAMRRFGAAFQLNTTGEGQTAQGGNSGSEGSAAGPTEGA